MSQNQDNSNALETRSFHEIYQHISTQKLIDASQKTENTENPEYCEEPSTKYLMECENKTLEEKTTESSTFESSTLEEDFEQSSIVNAQNPVKITSSKRSKQNSLNSKPSRTGAVILPVRSESQGYARYTEQITEKSKNRTETGSSEKSSGEKYMEQQTIKSYVYNTRSKTAKNK